MTRIIEKNREQLKEAIRVYRYEQGHEYEETVSHFQKEFGRKLVREVYNELRDEIQDEEQKKFIAEIESDRESCSGMHPVCEITITPQNAELYVDETDYITNPVFTPSKSVSGSRVKLVVGLFDMHIRGCDIGPFSRAAKCALKWCEDNHPDEIVIGGDYADCKAVSKWEESYPGHKKNNFLKTEMDYCNYGLDVMQNIVSRVGGSLTFMIGNHEDWIEKYAARDPWAREGFFDIASMMRLYDRKIPVFPLNSTYKVGSARIKHGNYVLMHHAAKTANCACGESVFYGHKHDVQCHTGIRETDQQPFVAQSCGCLCDLNPMFMRNNPNSWIHAFLILYVRDDGSFTYYVPQIVNGKFIWNGKEYAG